MSKNTSDHRTLVGLILVFLLGGIVLSTYFIITDWKMVASLPATQWIFLLFFWGGSLRVFAIVLELGRPKDQEQKS